MKFKFNKGSELDKQIYKEGDSTWGCKLGMLDVEDVIDFIKDIKTFIWRLPSDNERQWLCDRVNESAGASFHGGTK